MFRHLRLFSIVLLAGALFTLPARAEEPAASDQNIVVSLGNYTNDLHATFMGLKLATALRNKGAQVTLFLNLEAVRLVDKERPNDLDWGSSENIGAYYQGFVDAGGAVIVCPHCAEAAGLTAASLRDGAEIATDGQVADLMLLADKVISY